MDTHLIRQYHRKIRALIGGVFVAALILSGCASSPDHRSEAPHPVSDESILKNWGIEVIAIRLSAAGHMIDFAYRVVDSEKAAALLQKQVKPYLIDQASGAKMTVPRTRLGPMRQTAVLPQADRNYRILFANGGMVKTGSKVTVVIGDLRIENLVVD